jgi:hypothetical protein
MEMIGGKSSPRLARRVLVGIFCIALLLLGTSVQVAHTHADGQAAHADCSLCLSAHHSIEPTVSQSVMVTQTVSRAEAVEVQPDLKFRFVAFSLWNRPPPEGPAYS